MSKNENVIKLTQVVESIFEATFAIIDSMENGERIQMKDLAQTVGLAVAMDPKLVINFVSHFVHNSDLAYVARGKNGGVIKGSKNNIVKPS